jgi:hypothetical protein
MGYQPPTAGIVLASMDMEKEYEKDKVIFSLIITIAFTRINLHKKLVNCLSPRTTKRILRIRYKPNPDYLETSDST